MRRLLFLVLFSTNLFAQNHTNPGGGGDSVDPYKDDYMYSAECITWITKVMEVQKKICSKCETIQEFKEFTMATFLKLSVKFVAGESQAGMSPVFKCECQNKENWLDLLKQYNSDRVDKKRCAPEFEDKDHYYRTRIISESDFVK